MSAHPPKRTFRFDESSLSSSTTSSSSSPLPLVVPPPARGNLLPAAFPDPPGKTVKGFCLPSDVVASATVGVGLGDSSSQLPTAVPPSSDEEEVVNLILNINKTLALKANTYSSVEYVKGFILDKERIDGHRVLISFKGNPLADGQLLADYGIRGHAELDVILQDPASIILYVSILSTRQSILVQARDWDTIRDIKLMIQAREGVAPEDEFDLLFAGKLLLEGKTLSSLNLPPKPTFDLVLHQKDQLSLTVEMSSRSVTVDAKLRYTVGQLKAIAASVMSVQDASLGITYQGMQLDDCRCLSSYDIADGSVLQLVN